MKDPVTCCFFQSSDVKEARGCGVSCGCARVEENLIPYDIIAEWAIIGIPSPDTITAWSYEAAKFFKSEREIYLKKAREKAEQLAAKYPNTVKGTRRK